MRGRTALLAMAAACILAGGCRRVSGPDALEVERAMQRALAWLVAQQQQDGSFRSTVYGTLADGITLTPPALKALTFAPPSAEVIAARDRAAAYVREWIGHADPGPPDFPVYTASLAAVALSRLGGEENARAAAEWLVFLRSYQLTEALGWWPPDAAYGGFGYSVRTPSRPPEGTSLPFDSDLSSTLFALGALELAGAQYDSSIAKALVFVERCQNFPGDGGFFLTPTHPEQNKAGADGERFHSYGTATADGLRALLRCGLAPGHPRVVAARAWLETNFTATTNPGTFTPALEHDRDAAFFYWSWSVAHAFRMAGVTHVERDGARRPWATELAAELLQRQHEDGSFSNAFSFLKEDDPLVATTLALGALASCAEALRASP